MNEEFLHSIGVETWIAHDKPQDAVYAVHEATHQWESSTFAWLGTEKQRILDHAATEGYDYVWLVDSDLLHSPDTLSTLLADDKSVVSAVFWTQWVPDQPPLPQVWLNHPYELQGRGLQMHEFLERLRSRKLLRVWGLGASTLIRRDALGRFSFLPLVSGMPEGGMWQGEDRHACVRAERLHLDLWADAWPDIWHCYRPSDRSFLNERLRLLSAPQPERPHIGDLVSFTVEPIEEPDLADFVGRVRGVLGRLHIDPMLERALRDMRVGEERFVPIFFPIWSEIGQYQGQERLVRLKLLGLKSFIDPPTLEEHLLGIVQQQ